MSPEMKENVTTPISERLATVELYTNEIETAAARMSVDSGYIAAYARYDVESFPEDLRIRKTRLRLRWMKKNIERIESALLDLEELGEGGELNGNA